MIRRKNSQDISFELNNEIQNCQRCSISNLEFNIKEASKGYGKLYDWRGGNKKIKYFFIGMNPSHNRFENLEYAFGGRDFNEGTGVEFVNILKQVGIVEHSIVGNICKCSTNDNKINNEQISNCFYFLKKEIELTKPEKLIAMGTQVHVALVSFLETEDLKKLYKIWHPNYIVSYNRGLMSEYIKKIGEICQ
jgi:uracil-DNA glycosylase family 4